MDNDIIATIDNIHHLLKEHHQNNPNLAFDEKVIQKLGLNLATEIVKLPSEAQVLAWNIVGSSFSTVAAGEPYEKFGETGVEIAKGSIKVLLTEEQRDNFITGYSLYNTFGPDVPKETKEFKPK